MITSLQIERFRGIESGRLDGLTGVSVLVGPNGCGKSTILDALLLAADSATGEALARIVERRSGTPTPGRWLAYGGKAGKSAASVSVSDERGDSRAVFLTITTDEFGSNIDIAFRADVGGVTKPGDGLKVNVRSAAQSYSSGPVFPQAAGGEGIPLLDSRDEQEPLHRLFSAATNRGGRDLATQVVRSLIPWVERLEILTEADQPVLNLIPVGGGNIPIQMAGDGVKTLVRATLELVGVPSGLVLLEEPEAHLYPAALRQISRVIAETARRGVQIVLSTHSLELIDALVDALGADVATLLSVHRLRLSEGKLTSTTVSGGDVTFERGEIEADLR